MLDLSNLVNREQLGTYLVQFNTNMMMDFCFSKYLFQYKESNISTFLSYRFYNSP